MHIKRVLNTTGSARTEGLLIRVSTAEAAEIREKAKRAGMTISEYMRSSALGKTIRAKKHTAIVGMAELRKIAALLGYAMRSSEPDQRAQLEQLYRQAYAHFIALQIRAEVLSKEGEEDACN